VDQQANRGTQSKPRATLDPGRLNGSPGVTTSLKVTASVEDSLVADIPP
jgi:hypothetical protein